MTRFIKTRMGENKSSQKENHVPDVKKMVCSYYNCGGKAVGNYTLDLDVRGLNFCKKHKSDIGSAMLWCVLGVRELAAQALGHPPKKDKKKKQR